MNILKLHVYITLIMKYITLIMSFFKTKTQLFLLVFLIFVVFMVLSLLQYKSGKNKINNIKSNVEYEMKDRIKYIIQTHNNQITAHLNLLSFWDEFTYYINNPNDNWFKKEVCIGLEKNVGADYAWFFNKDFKLVYTYVADKSNSNFFKIPEITDPILLERIANKPSDNYSYLVNGIIVEVFFSSLYHTEDKNRLKKPEGYLFVAKMWNDSTIKSLGNLTNSSVSIEKVIEPLKIKDEIPDYMVAPRQTLFGYNGDAICDLRFLFAPALLYKYSHMLRYVSFNTLIIIVIALIFLLVYIYYLNIKPNKLLLLSLKKEQFDILGPVLKSKFAYNPKKQLSVLLSSLFIIFGIGLIIQYYIKINEIKNLTKEFEHARSGWIDRMIESNTNNYKAYLTELTNWDNFVYQVNHPDSNWFKKEITKALENLNIDYSVIYDKDLKVVYQYGPFKPNNTHILKKSDTLLITYLKSSTFHRYFVIEDGSLVEVFGASIHSTEDRNRIEPQKGYFFIAKIWTDQVIEHLGKLTNSSISIIRNNSLKEKDIIDDRTIPIISPLHFIDNSVTCNLHFSFRSEILYEYRNIFNYGLYNILIAITIITIFVICFYYLNIKPIKLLVHCMKTEQFDKLEPVLKGKTEISEIVKTIIEIVKQKDELSKQLKEKVQPSDKSTITEDKYKTVLENINCGIGFVEVIFDSGNKPVNYELTKLNRVLNDFLKPNNRYVADINEQNINNSKLLLKILDKEKILDVALTKRPAYFEIYVFSIYLHVYIFPYKPELLIALFTDITDIKEQSTQKETEKFDNEYIKKERIKILGETAHNIVHDINNSLTPIIGYSDLLLRDESNFKIHKMLQKIKASGNNIKDIIDKLKVFYRKKPQENEYILIDLNSIITNIINQLENDRSNKIPNKNIQIVKELSTELQNISGIKTEVEEVIVHIMNNAYDAINDDGLITVKTYTADNKAVVEIIDNGTGMDETTKLQCFEPFYSTKNPKQSGLGLTLAYHIMEHYNGKIVLNSSEKGTSVKLIFNC